MQAAFSINSRYGFQTGRLANGASVKMSENYMTGTSIANRVWLAKNRLALTLRGDVVRNPGACLAFSPSPVAANAFHYALAAGQDLAPFQGTLTLAVAPKRLILCRLALLASFMSQ